MSYCYEPAKWKPGDILCIRNQSELTAAPQTITDLRFENCTFTSPLDLRQYTDMVVLILWYNKPMQIHLPPNITHLAIYNTDIEYTEDLPTSLRSLIVHNCSKVFHISHLHNLETFHYEDCPHPLPMLPSCLKRLECSKMTLPEFPHELPPTLEVLFCMRCKLSALPALPASLRFLRCHNNPIKDLPPLSQGLTCLDVQDCQLERLPPLPKNLDELDVQNNNLTCIPEVPATVDYVNICGNPLQFYPYIYRTNGGTNGVTHVRVYFDNNSLAAAFESTTFTINGVKVFSPLHLLDGLETRYDNNLYMSDMFDDDESADTMLRRLQFMCEIQSQVLCRAFLKTIKEELMMRTWHPSRIEAWCGVDFMSNDD